MTFRSILDMEEPVKSVTRKAFFTDLNIDRILEDIVADNRKTAGLFEYFPLNAECERYRREVYRDIKSCGLYEALNSFCAEYAEFRDLERIKNDSGNDLQKPIWHFYGINKYTGAVDALLTDLENAEITSEGFRLLKEKLSEITRKPGYGEMKAEAGRLSEDLKEINVTAVYENGRVTIDIEDDTPEEEYENFLHSIDSTNEKEFINPFKTTNGLTGFEQEIAKIVTKRNTDLFKRAEKLFKDADKYEDPVLQLLADELPFYLLFYGFQKRLEARGCCFAEPGRDEDKPMEARGLYDLALTCVNLEKDREVVSNDMKYDREESFFVLTGPNQGGKTTFARSLGQLVYFTKLGLDVPAESANVHYFNDLLTHFSVEESVETGRGKLMEELVRLSPMMKHNVNNAFVVINELFTTAANYDAIIMGKNVLDHFINENCRGIYVTHLKELCDAETKESEGKITGLSAQLDENGIQNFKILKKSVAYESCAGNQIQKYRLGYEQLKERLKK